MHSFHGPDRPRASARAAAVAAVSAGLLAWAAPAPAQEILISPARCSAGVRLIAHRAHLSEVLQRMAATLRFQLRYQSEADPVVDIDRTGQPGDLVTRMAGSISLSMTQQPNPRCSSGRRIVELWILPSSQDRAVASDARRYAVQETPMQQFEVQQGADAYLRAHGLAPAE